MSGASALAALLLACAVFVLGRRWNDEAPPVFPAIVFALSLLILISEATP